MAFDLAGPRLGDFQRRAHRGVEGQVGFGEVGLGHKLGAQQRHHEQAADKNDHRQHHGAELVDQRPAQNALVDIDQRVGAVVKQPVTRPMVLSYKRDGRMVLAMRFNAGVVPDA